METFHVLLFVLYICCNIFTAVICTFTIEYSHIWPDKYIGYVIDGNFSLQHKYDILEAFALINHETCISFFPLDQARPLPNDLVILNFTWNPTWASCETMTGRIIPEDDKTRIFQEVKLAPACTVNEKTGAPVELLKVVLKTLGLIEDIYRSDRDCYITYNSENDRPLTNWDADTYFPFDYWSIFMNYENYKVAQGIQPEKAIGLELHHPLPKQPPWLSTLDTWGINFRFCNWQHPCATLYDCEAEGKKEKERNCEEPLRMNSHLQG